MLKLAEKPSQETVGETLLRLAAKPPVPHSE
jgi:hypothetical protein